MKNFIPLIGRILISSIFLASGLSKITNFAGTQEYMKAYGMPFTTLFLFGAILLELGGGLSVLLGFKARFGAIALIIFIIPATIIFHTNFSDQTQMIMFMKNLAILGGLIFITYFGPGPVSIDYRRKTGEQN